MNCFDWQNRASDYLDGTLAGPQRTDADDHLDGCQECMDRYRHYRILVETIASQPRTRLPIPIRRAPMTAPLPRRSFSSWRGRLQWQQMPWHLRTSIEGLAIVFIVLSAVSAGPRIRRYYERRMERNLSEFNQSFGDFTQISSEQILTEPSDPSRGASTAASQARDAANAPDRTAAASDNDEFAGGGDGPGGDDVTGGSSRDNQEVHVGAGEIWRFILKTDNPAEIRANIVRVLTERKIPPTLPGAAGIEVPGGIEFDLMVPETAIPPIKRQLQGMAPPAPKEFANTPESETFTWYRNKSKHPIPAHSSRLVIWVSQI